jgi:hypothetical protein
MGGGGQFGKDDSAQNSVVVIFKRWFTVKDLVLEFT